jgi:hypothetical protein
MIVAQTGAGDLFASGMVRPPSPMTITRLNPVYPGEILAEEFLAPLGITRHKLAIDLGIPVSRIDQIAKGKRSITEPLIRSPDASNLSCRLLAPEEEIDRWYEIKDEPEPREQAQLPGSMKVIFKL